MPGLASIACGMPAHYLLIPIEKNYNLIKGKPKSLKNLISDGFRFNNDINGLCNGTISPVQYSAIKKSDEGLAKSLSEFFVEAYSLLSDSRVISALDGIDDHYDTFFAKGANEPVCPFCGISSMLNPENSTREAYDHFFPKELYPFNSINFANLVPMCHTCNSKYKTRKDPINLRFGGPRKLVFYPFNKDKFEINIEFVFKSYDLENITSDDIDITIASNTHKEEVKSWKYIFGIEERYIAKCCETSAYKGWLEEYRLLLYAGMSISFDEYIKTKEVHKYTNVKFLEVAYLKACNNLSII
ncbi:hypothetical protein [Hymenobacter koreensis]|uniref:HNH endonuclease n=1 Tax=Hymenobacter koreensis TaxID=1084523 RepID=A0ABP8IY35_9BACT